MDLDTVISGHRSAQEKGIAMYWTDKDPLLKTDPLLLSRVLGNMVINALEATPKGETIKIWTQLTENSEVRWEVWNPAPIPDKIKKRIFQRYFSSKPGHGRGLGTYSIKLFGETYLNGRVRFESSEHSGTRFIFTPAFHPCRRIAK